MLMEDILTLLRENNAMLKHICAYIEKVESPQYQEQRQMTSFAINMTANQVYGMLERQQGNNQTANDL